MYTYIFSEAYCRLWKSIIQTYNYKEYTNNYNFTCSCYTLLYYSTNYNTHMLSTYMYIGGYIILSQIYNSYIVWPLIKRQMHFHIELEVRYSYLIKLVSSKREREREREREQVWEGCCVSQGMDNASNKRV